MRAPGFLKMKTSFPHSWNGRKLINFHLQSKKQHGQKLSHQTEAAEELNPAALTLLEVAKTGFLLVNLRCPSQGRSSFVYLPIKPD
jgi:hypothetical protein